MSVSLPPSISARTETTGTGPVDAASLNDGRAVHGIDLVEVSRIAQLLDEHPDRFVARCFTEGERRYAEASKRRAEHFAARFAAKEAVLKALGTGLTRGISWTDIEVTRDHAGAPGILLHGPAAEHAARLGIRRWLISLSHAGSFAMASVIGVAA